MPLVDQVVQLPRDGRPRTTAVPRAGQRRRRLLPLRMAGIQRLRLVRPRALVQVGVCGRLVGLALRRLGCVLTTIHIDSMFHANMVIYILSGYRQSTMRSPDASPSPTPRTMTRCSTVSKQANWTTVLDLSHPSSLPHCKICTYLMIAFGSVSERSGGLTLQQSTPSLCYTLPLPRSVLCALLPGPAPALCASHAGGGWDSQARVHGEL